MVRITTLAALGVLVAACGAKPSRPVPVATNVPAPTQPAPSPAPSPTPAPTPAPTGPMLEPLPTGPAKGQPSNSAITRYADRACACKDAACGTKVADEFADWLIANKDAQGDEDQAAKDGERMFKCLTDVNADIAKLMKAATEVTQ